MPRNVKDIFEKAYNALWRVKIPSEKRLAIHSIYFIEKLCGFHDPIPLPRLVKESQEELYHRFNIHLREYFLERDEWRDDSILNQLLPLPFEKTIRLHHMLLYLNCIHYDSLRNMKKEDVSDLIAGAVFCAGSPYPYIFSSLVKELMSSKKLKDKKVEKKQR